MHSSFTPKPLSYGQRQTCTVGVPWPNEVFYYAVVSVDEAGNRSPISNIISVYISEGEATEKAASSEDAEVELYEGAELITSSPNGLAKLRSKRLKTYIAVGVVCGLVLIVFILVTVILIRVKTRRQSQYDAERKDSYKAYEPNGEEKGDGGNLNKNLSSWLDSLPRSERATSEAVPDMHLEGGETLPKQHTLTKTNPYRHKVLTNGSFLNLKDLPAASSGSSAAGSGDDSRPTTSTEDSSEGRGDGGSSHHSSDDHFNLTQPDLDQSRGGRVKRSKSSGHHHPQQQQQSPSVIDTSTARAIIDTYSGNLFSDNYSNYVPYGSPAPVQHPHQQHDGGNYAGYNNGFDRYGGAGGNVDYSPQRQSFRLRTESVV